MNAIVKFRRLKPEEEYEIGDFHRLPKSKILWPVRSFIGGVVGEPRHLKTGREFYRIDLPLGEGAPITNEKE